ncbi:MAG: ABC transporter ATP-binding protein [Oscillospiraceae bacterium]|jgi:putative ABC transport system ATP-binding protein|nr:ABC transporter ATP-binding protein [Oscillospiraceae bacterium]
MSFINLEDVEKVYRTGEVETRAVDGVSFEIEQGELAIVLGPSGSGKTTMLNLLGGMDAPTGGKIVVGGQNIAAFSRNQLTKYRRSQTGFVFQFYNLVQNLTARENVELAAETSTDFIPSDEILTRVGLGERLDNFPAQLSGGEQQRVAIARALAKKPKLLLCDEPTGALDYTTGKLILKLLQSTCRESNTTVIIVTHNSAIAPMADRVVKFKNGKVSRVLYNQHPTDIDEIEW